MAVSALEIRRKIQQNAHCVEDVLVKHFVESINTGISEQVNHGRVEFVSSIPPVRMGFPCFDSSYVAQKVREAYKASGFCVGGHGLEVIISWGLTPARPPPPQIL
jgi:hypothetical protein